MADFPIIQKPHYGDACNRCGECCRRIPCLIAHHLLRQSRGVCRALETHPDGTTSCGIVVNPEKYVEQGVWDFTIATHRVLNPAIPIDAKATEVALYWLGQRGCDSMERPGIDDDIPLEADTSQVFEERVTARGMGPRL